MTDKPERDEPAAGDHPVHIWLVTTRVPASAEHNPAAKVHAHCAWSGHCSDSTGAHHTTLVMGPAEEYVRGSFPADVHITRIELYRENAYLASRHEGEQAYRLMNALKYIQMIAGMHYFGGAFEPEHMRGLANIAADALGGLKDLPDFEVMQEASQRRAQKWADRLSKAMSGD